MHTYSRFFFVCTAVTLSVGGDTCIWLVESLELNVDTGIRSDKEVKEETAGRDKNMMACYVSRAAPASSVARILWRGMVLAKRSVIDKTGLAHKTQRSERKAKSSAAKCVGPRILVNLLPSTSFLDNLSL